MWSGVINAHEKDYRTAYSYLYEALEAQLQGSISNLSLIFQSNEQTLWGSFSSVSTLNFATEDSLESSWRDLQDLHAFAPLRPQRFLKIVSFFRIFGQHFQTKFNKRYVSTFPIEFRADFDEIYSEFRRMLNVECSRKYWFLNFG